MFILYCSLLTMKVIPRSGRSPGVGNGNPLQYSHLQDSVVRGAWQATIYGCKELDMMSTHTQHYVKTANHHLTLQGGHKPSIHQKKKKQPSISVKPDKAKCNKARYACILSHFTLLWFLISFTPRQLSLIFLVAITVITRAQRWDSGPLQASPRCHCYATWLSKSTSPVASVSSSA